MYSNNALKENKNKRVGKTHAHQIYMTTMPNATIINAWQKVLGWKHHFILSFGMNNLVS